MDSQAGTLYLVATPIGNLEDITQRALRILNEVDLIAAEDTRHTLKLLNYFQIKKSLVSYYKYNEKEKAGELITALLNGKNIALVSDAGMPGISDPGNLLVMEAIKKEINVTPIPGASAVVTALAASGLDTRSFCFEGFLPRKQSEQIAKLQEIIDYQGSLVFYEAPHRLIQTLNNIYRIFGDRKVVIARELTKMHEEFIRGNLSQITAVIVTEKLKGEFTIVVEGSAFSVKNHQNSTKFDTEDLFKALKGDQKSIRKELKEISKKVGKSTKELYQMYLKAQKK